MYPLLTLQLCSQDGSSEQFIGELAEKCGMCYKRLTTKYACTGSFGTYLGKFHPYVIQSLGLIFPFLCSHSLALSPLQSVCHY